MNPFHKLFNYLYVGSYAASMLKIESFESDEHKKTIVLNALYLPVSVFWIPSIFLIALPVSFYLGGNQLKIFIAGLAVSPLVIVDLIIKPFFWKNKLYELPLLEYDNLEPEAKSKRHLSTLTALFLAAIAPIVFAIIYVIIF